MWRKGSPRGRHKHLQLSITKPVPDHACVPLSVLFVCQGTILGSAGHLDLAFFFQFENVRKCTNMYE